MPQSKSGVQTLLDSEGWSSDLVLTCTVEQTKPTVQPLALLGDRYLFSLGPNSEPWLGSPHIARRLKTLGLMLSSSVALTQRQATRGAPVHPRLFRGELVLLGRWAQRTGQRGGHSRAPRSARPVTDWRGGGERKSREGSKAGRQESPGPLPPPSAVPPQTPTAGAASWWGSRPSVPRPLQPSSHWCLRAFLLSQLLLTRNDVVFCFFLFPGSNQPKILSYRLQSKPGRFPVCLRQPRMGVAFWDPNIVSHRARGRIRAWKPRREGGTVEICSLNHPKKQPKTFLLTDISDLLCLICICMVSISWHWV